MDNKFADKLSGMMSRFSEKIETNHDKCVLAVEQKTDEIVELTKKVINKVEKICDEMKTRASVAKSKAEKDAKADVVEVNAKAEVETEAKARARADVNTSNKVDE